MKRHAILCFVIAGMDGKGIQMKQGKWKLLTKKLEMLFLIVVLLFCSVAPVIPVAAAVKLTTTKTQNVEDIAFSDFSNWRSGVYYYTNGKFTENSYRICLNNYVTFTGDEYKVHITDNHFRLLIRELNANQNMIRSLDLTDGQTYKPGSSAVYLAISVYKFSNGELDMSYDVFKEKFKNGFVAELTPVKSTSTGTAGTVGSVDTNQNTQAGTGNTTVSQKKAVEEIDFTDITNWKAGCYDYLTGQYVSFAGRICLNDYLNYQNDEYKVSINTSNFQMLIRELDKNMKLLKSSNLKNGELFEPYADTVYLAISIYNVSDFGITYSRYKTLFANGFVAKLVAVESDNDSADVVVTPQPDTSTGSSTGGSTVTAPKATVYDILADMIINGDTSTKDISSYKVTYFDFYNKIIPQLQEDLYIEYACYRKMYVEGIIEGNYVVQCKLANVDADAKNRIIRTKQAIKDFLATVDPKMKDLDKVLLAHEYIVNKTNYQFDDAGICYYAGGPLGNGTGVCSGYTKALNLLLNEMGIQTDYISSKSMNHAWTYVKLDGSWYHMDATWDDTRKGTDSKYMHRFMLRTDEEFTTTLTGNLHTGYTLKTATSAANSTRFKNWYVHDVAGSMYYYNGMWYYWDIKSNSILCSNIEGTVTKVVVDGSNSGKITLNGITGKTLTYTIGSTKYTKNL